MEERSGGPILPGVAIVAVGSELLDGDRQDTNSGWLARRLWSLGAAVDGVAVVPDRDEAVASAIRSALRGSNVIVCGGLGPTQDDRTRDGIALALGRSLAPNLEAEEMIRVRFRSLGRKPPSDQLRQAVFPEGAVALENSVGIAPGLVLRLDGRILAALPGVPAEMRAMFEGNVAALLRGAFPSVLVRRVLRVAGRSESAVDREVRDLLAAIPGGWTILAGERGIEIVLRARGSTASDATAQLVPYETALRARLGPDLFGADDETLAAVVGALLMQRSATVGCGESCSGGLVSAALTELPGSSGWFRGGVVAYSGECKRDLAGVPDELLARFGAVSEPVALALAQGARKSCGADYGIGVTGIAGPGGGTAEKPVGLVYTAVAGSEGARVWRSTMLGDRDTIRRRAVTSALDGLRRVLLGLR